MTLTTDQLHELTELVNQRLEEFGGTLTPLSVGVVRIAADVIIQWQRENEYPYRTGLARRDPQPAVSDEPLESLWSDPTVGEPVPATMRLPDPDACREKLAHALANGSAGELAMATHRAAQPRTSNQGTVLPTVDELVEELQRQAMAGTMPSMASFDTAKPAAWGTAQAQRKRIGMSWEELAGIAGLKPNRRYDT